VQQRCCDEVQARSAARDGQPRLVRTPTWSWAELLQRECRHRNGGAAASGRRTWRARERRSRFHVHDSQHWYSPKRSCESVNGLRFVSALLFICCADAIRRSATDSSYTNIDISEIPLDIMVCMLKYRMVSRMPGFAGRRLLCRAAKDDGRAEQRRAAKDDGRAEADENKAFQIRQSNRRKPITGTQGSSSILINAMSGEVFSSVLHADTKVNRCVVDFERTTTPSQQGYASKWFQGDLCFVSA
jgi:hypothetical protein